MANPKPGPDFRNVGVCARGELLEAITARAALRQCSLGAAARSLIEEAITAPAATALVDLSSVPTADLLDEVASRLAAVVDHEGALARAEAAEARLATIMGALAGAPPRGAA
jgi:hypothetical protein